MCHVLVSGSSPRRDVQWSGAAGCCREAEAVFASSQALGGREQAAAASTPEELWDPLQTPPRSPGVILGRARAESLASLSWACPFPGPYW